MEISKRKKLTIAIDGPSGAGKSTVGRSLAKQLGYVYIDTGAMYRVVALKVKEKFALPVDDLVLFRFASSFSFTFLNEGGRTHIFCDQEDMTEAIRSPEISRLASDISKRKGVREALVQIQRQMGRNGGVVMEGRDIGTVVFPDADVKFYLDAGTEERASRRFDELVKKGVNVHFQETLAEVRERDHNDMHRSLSPLKKADDAFIVDSTQKSVDEVVEEMMGIIKERI
jgi:cytidylate kinase